MHSTENNDLVVPFCKFQTNPINSKWGYYNLNGEKVCDFTFRYCSLYNGDYAIFGEYKIKDYPNLCYGLIDRSFKVIHQPIFNSLYPIHDRPNCFLGFLNTTFYNNDAVYLDSSRNVFLIGTKIFLLKSGITIVEKLNEGVFGYNSKGDLLFSKPYSFIDSQEKFFGFDKVVDYNEFGFSIDYSNIESEEINVSMWKGEETLSTAYSRTDKKIHFDNTGNETVLNVDSDSNHEQFNILNSTTQNFNFDFEKYNLLPVSYLEVVEDLISKKSLYDIDHRRLPNIKLYMNKSGFKFWSEATHMPNVVAIL